MQSSKLSVTSPSKICGRMLTNTQCSHAPFIKKETKSFWHCFLQMSFNFEHELAIQKMSLNIIGWLWPLKFLFHYFFYKLYTCQKHICTKCNQIIYKTTCNNQRWPQQKKWCNFLKTNTFLSFWNGEVKSTFLWKQIRQLSTDSLLHCG